MKPFLRAETSTREQLEETTRRLQRDQKVRLLLFVRFS